MGWRDNRLRVLLAVTALAVAGVLAQGALGQEARGRHRSVAPIVEPTASPLPNPEPNECQLSFILPDLCRDGAIGNDTVQQFSGLSNVEVDALVKAAANSLSSDTMTVAVVDRAGRPLAVYRKANADPANDDVALGVARTAAFFSNSQAPLSSRTIRFISQVHFPPGVVNAPVGALYGIEQSNRGCDMNVIWNPGKCVPRARAISTFISGNNGTCNAFVSTGCGQGLETGKILPNDPPYPQEPFNRPVLAGGIPLFRVLPPGLDNINKGTFSNSREVGAIGVVGVQGGTLDQLNEFASVSGAFGAINANVGAIVPLPRFPLPEPQNVFIDGIRLPFLGPDQKLKFNSNGLPIGLEQPAGTTAATSLTGAKYVYGPANGGCAPNEYLVGPNAGKLLTAQEVDTIIQRGVKASMRTRAQVRLPLNSYARMVLAIADVDGTILALYRMPDCLFDAVDVVPAKARNVVYFNSNDPAVRNDIPGVPAGKYVTTRTLGWGAQPLYPPGIDSGAFDGPKPGPWYSGLFLGNVNNPCSQGSQAKGPNQNGVTFFGGATPLIRNGVLVGGLGVSGDGIEQDDYVTYLAAAEYLPPTDTWADTVKVEGARLPMFKFPRQPEGVTECGGGPCS